MHGPCRAVARSQRGSIRHLRRLGVSPVANLAEAAAELAFAGYRLGGLALRPIIPLILSRRVARGKEDASRSVERYGVASRPRPAGRVVWVHAVSVGETNAVLPLIEHLTRSGFGVVLTTATVTAARIAERRLPSGAVHQFVPLDIGPFIRKFLAHWRPELAILVESELWPILISRTAAAGVPVVIVNGRVSDRSYRGWRRFAPVARLMLSHVRLCLACSERDGERFESLGASQVKVTGNIKFDVPAPDTDLSAVDDFRAMAGERLIWTAASTHDGEEAIVADAHIDLAGRGRPVLTIIVPRHPNRGDAIRSELTARGLGVAQRSRDEIVDPHTDIYLADTLGELGLFYRVAPVAFIGGSLIPHGGQNPIEPVMVGTAVIHGPHVHNFAEVYGALDAVVPAGRVNSAAELASTVWRFLEAPAQAEQSARQAKTVLDGHVGALDATVEALNAIIGGLDLDAGGA